MSEDGTADQAARPPPLQMPRRLIERARMLVSEDADWDIPQARDAATLVLVRDAEASFEIFLQRRLRSMSFAAGMYVFPGGVVEQGDRDEADALAQGSGGPQPVVATEGTESSRPLDTLAARIAALRETAEETGYVLEDPRSLAYIAHWVTPTVETRRYDTRFYSAAIEDSSIGPTILTEADAACWIAPEAALARYGKGELAMLPPTVAVVSQFAEYAHAGLTAAHAVESAASRLVLPMLPTVRADPTTADGVSWVIVNARTGDLIVDPAAQPAGSEVSGVNEGPR